MSFTNNTKKIIIISTLMVLLAFFFWTESRIPALSEKAQMGIRTQIDAIAFDVLLPVQDSYSAVKRIAYTFVNWIYTNWKGMTFGMLLAAGFLSLIRLLTFKPSNNIFINALKGAFLGAPLGVCVNCSTPIMQGLHRSGVRTETLLATLMSSPTLNVIVLTMSFSLLPIEIAVTKLLLVLLFILVVIPIIVRWSPLSKVIAEDKILKNSKKDSLLFTEQAVCDIGPVNLNKTYFQLISECIKDYAQHILFIVKIALPFMLLAGLLGSVMIELVPLNELQSLKASPMSIVVVAFIGAFLPVPIAMDVLLVSILVSIGMPIKLTASLAFTLGIFSIYPLMVIWRDISKKIAVSLFISVMVFGMLAGTIVEGYQQLETKKITTNFHEKYQQQKKLALELIINNTCQKAFGVEQASLCKRSYIIHQLEITKSDKICRALKEKKYRAYCYSRVNYFSTINNAITQNNVELCSGLKNSKLIPSCKNAVVTNLVAMGSTLSTCDLLSDNQQMSQCKLRSYLTHLIKYNDSDICMAFDEKNRNQCHQMTTIVEHTRSNNFQDCLALSSTKEINLCQAIISGILIEKKQGSAACLPLNNPLDKSTCLDKVLINQAVIEKNTSYCHQLTHANKTNSCLFKTANKIIDDSIVKHNIELTKPFSVSDLLNNNGIENTNNFEFTAPSQDLLAFVAESHLNIEYVDFQKSDTAIHPKQFSKHDLTEFNITLPETSFLDLKPPFVMGRGIASGDVNNDNWPDLIFATNKGLALYLNNGQGSFIQRPLAHMSTTEIDIQSVALVDINNDGWLDIYFAGYGGLNYFLLNDQHLFNTEKLIKVKNEQANLSFATGFADLNGNGYLDFLLGNWSFGDAKNFLTQYSTNQLMMNKALSFEPKRLAGEITGDTLSVLFSDINNDNLLDIYIANDVAEPDQVYINNAQTHFTKVKPEKLIPTTSFNTMSVDTADINNDLLLDVFMVDMSFTGYSDQRYCQTIKNPQEKKYCLSLIEGQRKSAFGDIQWCQSLTSVTQVNECMVMMLRDHAVHANDEKLCEQLPSTYPLQKKLCLNLVKKDPLNKPFAIFSEIPQQQSNKLLLANKEGKFIDVTESYGIGKSYWSWNAKWADLDNDGWQDVYIGNGYGFGGSQREVHSNVFFHNQAGKNMKNATLEFGLEDYASTPAYTYIDIDQDGDLDIVTRELITKGSVFINHNIKHNNALAITLRDNTGNYNAIGSKIIIHYADKHQLREVKLSGGFLSFDSTTAYFGLGKELSINNIEVIWPDGSKDSINKAMPTNRHYYITRSD